MNTKTNIIQLERKTERWANRIREAHSKTELWSNRTREAHSKTVESIIETGRILIEAKADCDHGEWGEITGQTTGKPMLRFNFRVAQKYMSIARHPFLSNASHATHLPASWDTLYQLSLLPPVDLEADLEAGRIHQKMTKADAIALRKPPKPETKPIEQPKATVTPLSIKPEDITEDSVIGQSIQRMNKIMAEHIEDDRRWQQDKANARAHTQQLIAQGLPSDVEPATDPAEERGLDVICKLRILISWLKTIDAKMTEPQLDEARECVYKINQFLEHEVTIYE